MNIRATRYVSHLGDTERDTKVHLIELAIKKLAQMSLHALLNKKHDPAIRNYTAFVVWHTKVTNKK